MDIKEMVQDILLEIGGNPSTKGFQFIVDSILTIDKNPEIQYSVLQLYEIVAQKNNTKSANVERNIRYAKDEILTKGNLENLENYFHYIDDKFSNSKFLATLYLKINRKRRVFNAN